MRLGLVRTSSVLLLILLGLAPQTTQPQPAASSSAIYDVILRRGTLIDGTGRSRYVGDVGVRGGRIAAIGDLSKARGNIDLNVDGLFVTPGFINLHGHPTAESLPKAVNLLTQGVTTDLINADGGGSPDVEAQLSAMGGAGLGVNIGAYIGFNSVWQAVVGVSDRRPGREEIARMADMIENGLTKGAWGVSAGLDYKPAYYARTDEVVDILLPVKKWRTNFTNHDRLMPEHDFSSVVASTETINIGRAAGLVPVVTHMKLQGVDQGRSSEMLERLAQSTVQGSYAAADVYPYLAGHSGLGSLFVPGWAFEGGREAMLTRFRDPKLRTRIAGDIEAAMNARLGGPSGVYVMDINEELTSVMRRMSVPAGEAVIRLLEQKPMFAILRFGTEADLANILRYPASAIACDCSDGHPRNYGTFPRLLGRYVREQNILTWEDAVRKMTGLPATIIGMNDRGFLSIGMAADIAIFDPATIIDHATFDQPRMLSTGVRHVLVNGSVALRDGKLTGVQGGRALRRAFYMPSRPMTPNTARKLQGGGRLAAVTEGKPDIADISFDVSQAKGAKFASGKLVLRSSQSQAALEAKSFGMLQMTNGWASFTAMLETPRGPRAIVVTVDRGSPRSNGRTMIYADVESLYQLSGEGSAKGIAGEAGR